MGHPFFCCDAVLDTQSRQIAIYSGYAKEMMPISWKLADKRTYVHWAERNMMYSYLVCHRISIMVMEWEPTDHDDAGFKCTGASIQESYE